MASDEVSEEAVYTCTGNPMPRDVQQIVEWIMNQSFAEAFASAPSPPGMCHAVRLKSYRAVPACHLCF